VSTGKNYFTPADYRPDLTMERLSLVATTLAHAVNSAFELADEEAGDGLLGCAWRGLDRTRNKLKGLKAVTFEVEHGIAYCLFFGDGVERPRVPVRVSRSDKEVPRVYPNEAAALRLAQQLALDLGPQQPEDFPDAILRLELEYTPSRKVKNRRVERITLKLLNRTNETCHLRWPIWEMTAAPSVPAVPTPLHAPADSIPQADFEHLDDVDYQEHEGSSE